jgi:hypothetical protein
MNQPKYSSLKDYLYGVADYIGLEYGDMEDGKPLSQDEKYVIHQMSAAHYEGGDSIANTASYIMEYLRTSRKWMEELNG